MKELRLIAESGFRACPPRLPHQPIFDPVLTLEYARQIARDWNTKDAASGHAGFVTRFDVDDAFVRSYPVQTAGGRTHQELWVPAEDLPAFNAHIVGGIQVIEAYSGPNFPDRSIPSRRFRSTFRGEGSQLSLRAQDDQIAAPWTLLAHPTQQWTVRVRPRVGRPGNGARGENAHGDARRSRRLVRTAPADESDDCGRKILRQGDAHVVMISWSGGEVLGLVDGDGVEPLYQVSDVTNRSALMKSFAKLRTATTRERKTLTVFDTWGLESIKALAELYFVESRRPKDRARDFWAQFKRRAPLRP